VLFQFRGAARRGCVAVVEDLPHAAVTKNRYVINRVRAGDHPTDQRGDVQSGVGALVGGDGQPLISQGPGVRTWTVGLRSEFPDSCAFCRIGAVNRPQFSRESTCTHERFEQGAEHRAHWRGVGLKSSNHGSDLLQNISRQDVYVRTPGHLACGPNRGRMPLRPTSTSSHATHRPFQRVQISTA